MKNLFLIGSVFLLASFNARADALLTCKDSSGQMVFQGYVGTEMSPISEKITREVDIPYEFAVAAKQTIGVDRATFTRMTGINLKKCMGPYAHIHEKLAAGKFRCAAGSVKSVDGEMAENDEVLAAFALPKEVLVCSAIVDKDKIGGLPASR